MNKIIAVLALIASTVSIADDGWVKIADNAWIQKGSAVADAEVVGATIRIKSDTVKFYRFAVTGEVCDKGYGHVVVTNINFEDASKIDYVKNGGTLAANIADILCIIKKQLNEEGGI
jgi:hypothetical protein